MTSLLASQTTAATSNAFTMAGEGKIIADPLGAAEYISLLEASPDGTYRPVINQEGVAVQLTQKQQSQIFVGYGSYKVAKTVTADAVAVGLES